MELKISDKVVGSIYFNIKLSKESLAEPMSQILNKIKNKQYTFTFGKSTVVISSYRKLYNSEDNIYVEGAVFE